MIKKELNGTPGAALVTFQLPAVAAASEVAVVGEFNGWSTEAHPMARVDGHFEVSVELPVGHRYRFRYLLDSERWENDWAADAYEDNEFGGADSVVDLSDPGSTTGAGR